ncbi:MAG: hypothetical protein LDLANPLL_00759 [Turneriella sp.]|nr:hypothetical protein [Turneriella sp.]
MELKGYLFDVYNFESDIHLWIKDEQGNMHLLRDTFYPIIYAHATQDYLRKLVKRLKDLDALAERPTFVTKRHFYKNEDVEVLRLVISRPSLLNKIKRKLFAMINNMDIYHSDVEIPNAYMHEKHIYPFAPVIARVKKPPLWNQIDAIVALEPETMLNYGIPPLRRMEISMEHSHRLGVSVRNRIHVKCDKESIYLTGQDVSSDIRNLNCMLMAYDPDVILTSYGDQTIMPTLFSWSTRTKIPLALDRDLVPGLQRSIVRKGLSVNTYGAWIFRAASYPLYGRLHIDSGNSFVFSNSGFAGVIELSRLSRTPVQRVARTSTGAALTNMEVHNAMDRQYLVPWQKSKVESWRTAYAMNEGDKGGMIFQPNIHEGHVYENVAQLDYAQMYPSIMVNHNISPECVNCECCALDPTVPRAPESHWHICKKRQGIVAQTLSHILDRRKHYKSLLRTHYDPDIDAKQSALKWLLVTSFGYMGYRNAKFGRLESHEAVTSFGREILLRAKELAEDMGYELLHAITDSMFIRNPDGSPIDREHLQVLCQRIYEATQIEMAIEGVYQWTIFLPSKVDPEASVANRYVGLFDNGNLKVRGLITRRKDMPLFVKSFQSELLEIMQRHTTLTALRSVHKTVVNLYERYKERLNDRHVPWRDLLLRKTVSRGASDYAVSTGTAMAMLQIQKQGIEVQPGEKIRYLVTKQASQNPKQRYIAEEEALSFSTEANIQYDVEYYHKLLLNAFEELWQFFAPPHFFEVLRLSGTEPTLFRFAY